MKNQNLTIIIITYNSQDHIESCLKSIELQGIKSNILIIDNNSNDDTWKKLQIIKKTHITLVKNKINSGFAKAVNQGFRYANRKFNSSLFLLLNPDALLGRNCLENLIKKISSDEELVLCSPIIKNPQNNQILFRQGQINWWKMNTAHTTENSSSSDYLTGCCLLIKKAVIDKINGFDERFFLYYEDTDFCLRARQNDFQIKTIPSITCFHEESRSSNSDTKNYHLVKNGLIFFHKHFSYPIRFLYFWPIFWIRLAYHTLISRKKPVIQGLKDFYLRS